MIGVFEERNFLVSNEAGAKDQAKVEDDWLVCRLSRSDLSVQARPHLHYRGFYLPFVYLLPTLFRPRQDFTTAEQMSPQIDDTPDLPETDSFIRPTICIHIDPGLLRSCKV